MDLFLTKSSHNWHAHTPSVSFRESVSPVLQFNVNFVRERKNSDSGGDEEASLMGYYVVYTGK